MISRGVSLDLCAQLLRPADRAAAVRALAAALEVDELLLFLPDPAVGALLPAPGLPQTLHGGPSWRTFLRGCTRPGRREGRVELPRGTSRSAIALVTEQVTAVLLDGVPHVAETERFRQLLPLIGWGLAGEQGVALAHTEAAEAREAASRAQALAKALDRARGELAALNVALRDEHRRKDEFLAMLAHELRNPLAPVVTSVELLEGQLVDATVRRHLDVLKRQTRQLTRLLDALLDVSRLSRGRIELNREPLPLADVVGAAVEAAMTGRPQRIEVALGDEPPLVDGDPVRLHQVFVNLLDNAAKFTPPGGTISVCARKAGDRAIVEVRDTGAGIEAEVLPRVFDLFVQGSVTSDRPQGGLGIGLTMVRSIVELHGGSVAAHSPGPGRGSTFTVQLPLAAHRAAGAAPDAAAVAPPPQRVRVLVVDDNRDAAESLCSMLEVMGHEAHATFDGASALARVEALDPEVVLLDLGLPGMDGLEVARRIRGGAVRQPRLVALTGYGAPEDRRRSAEAGFDAHLVKPASLEALREVLVPGAAGSRRDAALSTGAPSDR